MTRRYTVDVAGERLFLARSDGNCEEDEQRVLLIHGAGGNYLHWPPRLRRMENAVVYALDLPGHGESTGRCFDSVQAYAEIVNQLVVGMGLDNVVLVGHSLGAAIAMAVASMTEVRIAGLGLLACGDELPIPESIQELLVSDFAAAADFIAEASSSGFTTPKMRRVYESRILAGDPECLRRDFVAASHFMGNSIVDQLLMPVVIIAGEDDQMIPLSACERLHAVLKNSEMRMLANAGHMLHWEREEETISALQSLLLRTHECS